MEPFMNVFNDEISLATVVIAQQAEAPFDLAA